MHAAGNYVSVRPALGGACQNRGIAWFVASAVHRPRLSLRVEECTLVRGVRHSPGALVRRNLGVEESTGLWRPACTGDACLTNPPLVRGVRHATAGPVWRNLMTPCATHCKKRMFTPYFLYKLGDTGDVNYLCTKCLCLDPEEDVKKEDFFLSKLYV